MPNSARRVPLEIYIARIFRPNSVLPLFSSTQTRTTATLTTLFKALLFTPCQHLLFPSSDRSLFDYISSPWLRVVITAASFYELQRSLLQRTVSTCTFNNDSSTCIQSPTTVIVSTGIRSWCKACPSLPLQRCPTTLRVFPVIQSFFPTGVGALWRGYWHRYVQYEGWLGCQGSKRVVLLWVANHHLLVQTLVHSTSTWWIWTLQHAYNQTRAPSSRVPFFKHVFCQDPGSICLALLVGDHYILPACCWMVPLSSGNAVIFTSNAQAKVNGW